MRARLRLTPQPTPNVFQHSIAGLPRPVHRRFERTQLDAADRTRLPFRRSARRSAGEAAAIPEFVEFTLSAYSLPYSDNTLLRSGNRVGLYIRQVEAEP